MDWRRVREGLLVVAVVGMIALAGCTGPSGDADTGDQTDKGLSGPEERTNDTTTDGSTPVLQQTEQEAGQQAGAQVTDRLQIVSATGNVDTDTNTITSVNLTVKRAPGSADIDLRNVTATWVEDGGTYQLASSDVDAGGADGHFGIDPFKDVDGSSPVLNDPDDRVKLTMDVGADTVGTDNGVEGESFGENLAEGQLVTIRIATTSGVTTTARLVVPETLAGAEVVAL